MQAVHPCTVSVRYGAGLDAARLVDDWSSLIAVAGCRRSLADRRSEAANGGQPVRQRAQLLAGADARQRRRGREDARGQALRTEPVRSEVDPEQWMVNPPIAPNSLQLPLLFLKAGPAGGRLRRPSSRRQPHSGHRGTGLTLPSRESQSGHRLTKSVLPGAQLRPPTLSGKSGTLRRSGH